MNEDDRPVRIIRAAHDRDYFVCSRKTAQDNNISFEALGVLIYLLSQSDGWQANVKDISKRSTKYKIYKILRELRKAGYMTLEKEKGAGRFSQWVYSVFETPQLIQNQQVEIQLVENQHTKIVQNGIENTKKNTRADAPIPSVPTKSKTKPIAPTTEQCMALINAWVESAGLVDMGQKWGTTSRMKHAKAMLSWPIPVTCEEIKNFTKHLLATKQSITFEFIQGNLGLWRSANAPKPVPRKDPNKPMTETEYTLLLIKEQQEKEAALYGWS